MNNIVVKLCAVRHTGKSIDALYDKYRECKHCNIKRVLKRHYHKKDGILQKRR